MDPNGLIFNSVSQFVIQAGRTKRWVKRDELDTLSEVWVGPSNIEDSFVPMIGSKHPDYSLMRVISVDANRQAPGVTIVTLNYQGKLKNGGLYVSPPTISPYWSEGEVSFTRTISVYTSAGGTSAVGVGQQNVGAQSINRRYTGRCVEIAFITNGVPTGKPTNLGLAKGWLGFSNVWDIAGTIQYGVQAAGGVIQQMACTDVRIEDTADGWYHVKETYQSRMFPFGGPVPIPGFGMSGGNTISKYDTWPSTNNDLSPGMKASAQVAYTGEGGSGQIPMSSDPVAQLVYQSTGVDPNWESAIQSEASNAAGSGLTLGSLEVTVGSTGYY